VSRLHLTLVIVLVALLAVDLMTLPSATTRATGGPLFSEFEPERANRIKVGAPGASPLVVQRGDDGWLLPDRFLFPADDWLMDELLAALTRVSRADLVAENPTDPGDFGLAEGQGVEVEITDDAGLVVAAYRQGEQLARAGGIDGVYLSPAGSNAVYRAPLVPRLTGDERSWLETRVAEFDPGRVRALALEVAGERSETFERGANGSWTRVAGEAPEVPLDRLVNAVGGLFHSGVAALKASDEHGLSAPRLCVELVLAPNLEDDVDSAPTTVRLEIGSSVDGNTYVTWTGWSRPWVVEVRDGLMQGLLEPLLEVFGVAELVER
jgi:hypothetical protein